MHPPNPWSSARSIASRHRCRTLSPQLARAERHLAALVAEQLRNDQSRLLQGLLDRLLAFLILTLVEGVLRHREPLHDVVVDLERLSLPHLHILEELRSAQNARVAAAEREVVE